MESFSQKIILFFSAMSGTSAYASIFGVLLICGFGVPIPEDITLISAGILVSLGNISFLGAFVISMLGVLVGDSCLFFIGRWYGEKVFTWPLIKKIASPSRVEKAKERIQKNGRFICFIGRFLPGLRAIVYLTAGTMRIKPSTFLFQDGLAALLSVPLWIWFGYFFGSNIEHLLELVQEVQLYLLLAIVLFIITYITMKLHRKKTS